MTSAESDALKTNDFQRRRKLRIQQVREQSKDIAKKLRQRTKCETLQHIVDLDARKGKQYLEHQDKLIKRLEQLYAQGVRSVGSGHNKAAEVTEARSHAIGGYDLSKLRGKEAALELKRKKQEHLDQQKKLLDRKVLAREAANIISREKSSTASKKFLVKASDKSIEAEQNNENPLNEHEKVGGAAEINKNDMATQWNFDEATNESEHCVPALSLPKDDKESEKDVPESKTEKSKHLDLFALSSDMPSSLRGGASITREERLTLRPSLTMVSEYLQNRALRLRETDNPTTKKPNNDLHSLKQTILRSRSSRIEGTNLACCVLDDQVIPVPSWHAESNCKLYSYRKPAYFIENDNFRSLRPVHTVLYPTPTLRDSSPFRRNKDIKNSAKETEKSLSSGNESNITRKNCVMMYSHSTRNTRDIPCDDTNLVVKDSQLEEDAYSQAFRQTSNENTNEEHLKRLQEMRSKVAVTKHAVEKEYNETMSILNKMPKEKLSKSLKTSYMDESRQKMQKDRHQQKLQHEFRKIEKEHRKDCKKKLPRSQHSTQDVIEDADFERDHMQYSWMPVPESDGSLAIHSIPTTAKEGKTANTVKFSQADTYHEYRSKHKHTPPTKDININKQNKANIETVFIQNDGSDMNNYSTSSLDTSSVENLNLETESEKKPSENVSGTDKIIIYKILKTKMDKKDKERKKLKLIDDVARVLNSMNKKRYQNVISKNTEFEQSKNPVNVATVGEINEGIYEVVSQKGLSYNMSSYYTTNTEMWQRRVDRKPWWENITAFFPAKRDKDRLDERVNTKPCTCDKKGSEDSIRGTNSHLGDKSFIRAQSEACKEDCAINLKSTENTYKEPSTSTSMSSFKTAVTVEKSIGNEPCVKLSTDNNQDAGKLYIGASGFLKDEAYEVIIQLRKKDNANVDGKESVSQSTENKSISNTHIAENSSKVARDILSASNEEETSKPDSGIICSETLSKRVSSQDLSHLQTADFAVELPNNKDTNNQADVNAGLVETIPKETIDRAVHTTPQHSFAIPDYFRKTEPIVRPTTSTYTQTSINSPSLRPTFHMSSSTSTAYMSPPDTILPNYLKQYCSKIDAAHTSQDELNETTEPTSENIYECSKFKGYRRYGKSFRNKETSRPSLKKCFCLHNCRRGNCLDHVFEKRNKKCHKRESHASSYSQCSCHNHKNKYKIAKTKTHTISSAPKIHKTDNADKNKSNLNPAIKKYVNKLLELNNNGLKAIEIANQECSSVTTPNSSIVNVPHNINKSKTNISTQISLEQLRDFLKRQLISEIDIKDTRNSKRCVSKTPKSKHTVHKVKSLNISKKLIKSKRLNRTPFFKSTYGDIISSPTLFRRSTSRDHIRNEFDNIPLNSKCTSYIERKSSSHKNAIECNPYVLPLNKATLTCLESEKENIRSDLAVDSSTQTISQNFDSEVNIVKIAEGKIQNMEKIADLTEKCTKRLSNLAKVLDEVRRNKSLAYSHISTSDTASDSEQKSEKYMNKKEICQQINNSNRTEKTEELISPTYENINNNVPMVSEYIPFLKDIPKPAEFKCSSGKPNSDIVNIIDTQYTSKSRAKPPPALLRSNLKHRQDVVPHELSTVVEVDSPMSIKLKKQTSTSCNSENVTNIYDSNSVADLNLNKDNIKQDGNPDLLQSNITLANDFINNSKMQMMDIKQFNDVMLKPFISLQEYAKQSDGALDEVSNYEDINNKGNEKGSDDISSLHSDGSLPDVISELLKRNIITEPFKFDTLSNVNSTTLSSESTISVLALSKVRNTKKKSSVAFDNKENVSETSDSLSMSSNPDLENAFKKLGMGWASSTLKKTKERLALSSSSNTSSSSISHFKIKTVNESDIRELVTDSMSSVTKSSKRAKRREKLYDDAKNAEQQTSLGNSMTVKEFLTNELAKKITFTNKSNKNETTEEFISLLETKLPDEMKGITHLDAENTAESLPSGNNNRARTSTPVQIFKSLTYQSSTSSNSSKGLFSNADDLSSVKGTSNSLRNHSTSEKDDLTVPNCSLKVRKNSPAYSKSE